MKRSVAEQYSFFPKQRNPTCDPNPAHPQMRIGEKNIDVQMYNFEEKVENARKNILQSHPNNPYSNAQTKRKQLQEGANSQNKLINLHHRKRISENRFNCILEQKVKPIKQIGIHKLISPLKLHCSKSKNRKNEIIKYFPHNINVNGVSNLLQNCQERYYDKKRSQFRNCRKYSEKHETRTIIFDKVQKVEKKKKEKNNVEVVSLVSITIFCLGLILLLKLLL